jgi:hypothetical protein
MLATADQLRKLAPPGTPIDGKSQRAVISFSGGVPLICRRISKVAGREGWYRTEHEGRRGVSFQMIINCGIFSLRINAAK